MLKDIYSKSVLLSYLSRVKTIQIAEKGKRAYIPLLSLRSWFISDTPQSSPSQIAPIQMNITRQQAHSFVIFKHMNLQLNILQKLNRSYLTIPSQIQPKKLIHKNASLPETTYYSPNLPDTATSNLTPTQI